MEQLLLKKTYKILRKYQAQVIEIPEMIGS